MREIKFRAWYPDVDMPGQRCSMQDEMTLLDFFQSLEDAKENEAEKYILMQFTGLKDKNGKEIYEGDVVGATDEMNGANVVGTVNYYNRLGWFAVEFYGNDIGHLNFNDLINIEVIGNIYENPDLLK